ncbi:acetyl-CoA synthetase-like protein [Meira miltonrushii]|uniref:Acetyl-CoA synthetase-like protein n=1 Tax=Meira miltonrushii TaxID=1280837 RepID=A0A316V5I4_9BASI|nr:acetyl-CoA synthetase-like protein [Meira miltonrushii]PWN31483.1 acetyl-CoA synthetase-like protein [Meira miltonrushii]
MTVDKLLTWWEPSQEIIESSNLNKFRKILNATYKIDLQTYEDIHAFSVDNLEQFWSTFWQWSGLRVHKKYTNVLTPANALPEQVPKFFQDAKLNLAENILFPLHPKNSTACMPNPPKGWPHDKQVAIYEWGESLPEEAANGQGAKQWGEVTWGEMRRRVAILSETFRKKGLKAGDRVAHISANSANPIVTFLACLSIGCIFSALPTDAGAQAIYGRLAQVQPRLILTDDVAFYNGKKVNVIDRVAQVTDDLIKNKKTAGQTIEVVCIINQREGGRVNETIEWNGKSVSCSSFPQFVASAGLKYDAKDDEIPKLHFEALPFNHPALIVFSSGTTGEPKSICHSSGGILINGKKEGLFQYEMKGTEDTFFQITTCGWIMWLAQTCKLLMGSSIITYDGSPLFPHAFVVPKIIHEHGKVTGYGGSPRLLSEIERACKSQGIERLRDRFPMKNLRFATSTGSPLNPANVQFFYQSLAFPHTQLISISGGTDLAGCLVGSSCMVPVKGHLIGTKSLGMDIRIVDPLTGEDCEDSGEPGELVVAKPFPTQPLYFWGDEKDKEALHEKYMDSYYRRFESGPAKGWWAQGDFISKNVQSKAFEIHGRSDGVLNPSGVRFGSAEIYSVVESGKFPFVLDSIVVGQRRQNKDDDERVILFIKCRQGQSLDEAKKQEIGKAIKEAFSARHVPKYIFQVKDIPITANGKKTELAVKAIVSGNTKFKPSSAIANPEALDEYRQYANIESVVSHSRSSRL